jgi:L-amino acid N-acyltransferase YncA
MRGVLSAGVRLLGFRLCDRETTPPVQAPGAASTWLLRPARKDDALPIARVFVRSWQAAYRGHMPDSFVNGPTVEGTAKRWRRRLSGKHQDKETWVVEGDGAVVGFARTGPCRDADAGPAWGEVYTIYLSPEWWGRGAGRTLFAHAVESLSARDFRPLVVWVVESNRRARRFYEQAGCRLDGVTKAGTQHGAENRRVRYRLD